jgi:hypothetical protein
MRRKTMKTMFFAAAIALTLGMGSSFAQSSPSASGYVYPNFWGDQAAQTATQGHAATQLSRGSIGTFATQTHTDVNGIWLFPPNPNSGG